VFLIRDILVRIRIRTSDLRNTDPDPNPTPFFSARLPLIEFRMKNILIHEISFKTLKLCYKYKIKFLARQILYLNLILQVLFQSDQRLYEKKEIYGSVHLTFSGSGWPKTLPGPL
jgi:hypothetical protein